MTKAQHTPQEIISQGRANNIQSAKRLIEICRLEEINAELLEALVACEAYYAKNGGPRKQWDNAKAAIAKAKGE